MSLLCAQPGEEIARTVERATRRGKHDDRQAAFNQGQWPMPEIGSRKGRRYYIAGLRQLQRCLARSAVLEAPAKHNTIALMDIPFYQATHCGLAAESFCDQLWQVIAR